MDYTHATSPMSMVRVQNESRIASHSRALLSGGLGVFVSLLTIGWAIFAYSLPSAVNVSTSGSQNLMLLQLGLAFITLLGSGLMLATYTAPGGAVNILGSLGTFIIGIYYSSGVADAVKANDLSALPLRFSSFYNGTVNIPTDRIVFTFLVVPVFPLAVLLLISGLGAISTYRTHRRIGSL